MAKTYKMAQSGSKLSSNSHLGSSSKPNDSRQLEDYRKKYRPQHRGPKFGPRHRNQEPYQPFPTNHHHILYQGRYWNRGWAARLREHPYLKKMIPQDTLHRIIHSKIHDIPCPNSRECRRAYELIEERLRGGVINVETDTLEQRIDLLIECWKGICPATVEVLYWQRDVVFKFYDRIRKQKEARAAKAAQAQASSHKHRRRQSGSTRPAPRAAC